MKLMMSAESDPNLMSEPWLRFHCGSCQHELEAPAAYAGVEGPCPQCGKMVRAPEASRKSQGGIHLPPLAEEMEDFWEQGEVLPDQPIPTFNPLSLPVVTESPNLLELPLVRQPSGPPLQLLSRAEEEALEVAHDRQRAFRLKFFDAALLLLFAGTLAMGGAAVAFTQSKREAMPVAAPELSRQVMERMEQVDRRRDRAVSEAREAVRRWVMATSAEGPGSADWCLPGDPVPGIPGSAVGSGMAPLDFEFIQARRIPGTERFLTTFEVLSDPPLVVPVEETPVGPRLHGRAICQQQAGLLGKFLASQGQGEAVFYVLLRPGLPAMAEELERIRPDLQGFLQVAVEPAFAADGSAACLACVAPDSMAASILAKRAHDPGLRPAVVRLAWRQHRESGNYVELVSFEPNVWSRH